MARKKALTNEEVLERLCAAGLWKNGEPWLHDPKYETVGPFGKLFKKGYGTNPNLYYFRPTTYNYMIPIDVYKKHVASTYRVFIPKGAQVRKRSKSSRIYERSKYSNVLCDTRDFDHLGIGTGAMYKSDRVKEIERAYNAQNTGYYGRSHLNESAQRVLIGNKNYPANSIAAYEKVMRYRAAGLKKGSDNDYYWNREFYVSDFLKRIKIKGDGFFGPKECINGVVSNVFVHFLYPKWVTKRESRFEVQFETGAKGIFTSDYLDRVFDTDYDVDESMCYCDSVIPNDLVCNKCSHRHAHLKKSDCEKMCWKHHRNTCRVEYDYDTLIDTTCGKALDYVEKE